MELRPDVFLKRRVCIKEHLQRVAPHPAALKTVLLNYIVAPRQLSVLARRDCDPATLLRGASTTAPPPWAPRPAAARAAHHSRHGAITLNKA
eukprot:6185588-Pleurochrysis_carterae.AAC.3